jgi:hypothetical protein
MMREQNDLSAMSEDRESGVSIGFNTSGHTG